MKKFAIAVPIFGLVICFYACSHSPFTPATNATHDTTNATTHITPPPDTTSTSNVADTSVCFARDILPMLQSSCGISGCHDAASAKKGYVYTSYNTIMAYGIVAYKPNSSATYAYCYSGKMPKSPIPKLDSTQMSLLKRWIANGAHNDSNCAVSCDTSKYTYSNAIAPMMKSYCTSCHSTASAASAGGNIILDTYAAILVQAQNGKLLGDVQHASGFNYMPLGGTKLSDCKITQISKWIAAGAPNN